MKLWGALTRMLCWKGLLDALVTSETWGSGGGPPGAVETLVDGQASRDGLDWSLNFAPVEGRVQTRR